ncbi:Chaperone protein DnaJ [Psilocybe cubensis]|uniref:Chaperone protein DnaJ n=2 Tax=Psilocybe cubensis TaxID=181762 RepID=A0ACB8H7D3_PSICU|nr:Chaperone protein DnaJ [Psilocybe cubensis]KAH9483848.1 Chaperone protein DnaJ [Psilocybe cubensis]
MALRPEVLQAFTLLGIDPDADIQVATKAYKRQALLHHPDRNHGDPKATQRFQEIGAAWNICQRHLDNPAWGLSEFQASYTSTKNTYRFAADDDIPLDEDELHQFYMFMFAETLFGRYTRSKGQRYRYERSGRTGGGIYSFSGGLAKSQERQARNTERQRRENEEYEKRKRELELEIEQEQREHSLLEKRNKADEDRRAKALANAFRAASSGDSASVKNAIIEYDLDVNAPQKRSKGPKKQDTVPHSDSLLHVVAGHCDEKLFMFLIERGANPVALNKAQLTPFHVAIRAGNTSIVQYIMEHRGRAFDVYHPSKASLSGLTPLQLAIESGVPSVVELLVKHATTHDVERCWKSKDCSEEIKEILLKKKGFVPPEIHSSPLEPAPSKKLQRQKELALEKQARLTLELERATINRRRREERARKREEKDREEAAITLAQEHARLKEEMEERQRLEDNRREQEQVRLQAEMKERQQLETIHRAQEQSRLKAEMERKRLEDDCRLQGRPRTKVEGESPLRVEVEKRALVTSRPMVKRKERSGKDQSEKEEPAMETSERPRHRSKESHSRTSSLTTSVDAPVEIEKVVPPPNVVNVDERTADRSLKIKEKRKEVMAKRRREKKNEQAGKPTLAIANNISSMPKAESSKKHHYMMTAKDGQNTVDEVDRKRNEEILRRRAEQSARDKERHRRLVEERAKAAEINRRSDAGTDSSLLLAHVSTGRRPEQEIARAENNRIPSQAPLLVPQATIPLSGADFENYIEDIQTCIVPEDLFGEEREPGFVSSRGRGRRRPRYFGSR